MSNESIRINLEKRIFSTLKLNPQMTYTDAVECVLQSMGIITTLSTKTGDKRENITKTGNWS